MRLLQDTVTRQADRRPDACAVVLGDERLSYGALDATSNQLARFLRDLGCEAGDRVGVLMPKSPAAVTAILGIYKAGCVFVPLDPASPPARLKRVLDSCESRCVLTCGPTPAIEELRLTAALRDVDWRPAVAAYSAEPVMTSRASGDAAHILFTSGSTGAPKGVVITHANVLAFVTWATRYFGMNGSDRVSGHSPLHFDLSTFDLFGAFAAGAELHLVPPEANLVPHALADFIRRSALTQWFSVPSILNYLARFDAVRPSDFPAMKRLLWCGEVFPTPALIYWMTRLPHVTFTNLYGPTEATIASGYHTLYACPATPSEEVPIGTGCGGEELLVLDDRLAPVPAGESGDLYIRGAGLSPGYWREPEKTAAVFLSDPENAADRLYKTGDIARVGSDGLVYFLGRADSQIKSRGYRIELGEIEAALTAIDGVQEAAVVGVPSDGFEGTAIACAYAMLPGRPAAPADLRKALAAAVPPYMLPTRWMALVTLPKNATGKIDRRAIRDQFIEADHPHEARLA
jgi:amino acid adenylation domain-containing protein